MDHKIDPNHIPHCDDLSHWALLEGRSDATSQDLRQRHRHGSQSTAEKIQTALGVVVVIAVCCFSAWSALRGADDRTEESRLDDASLAQREFHFRP